MNLRFVAAALLSGARLADFSSFFAATLDREFVGAAMVLTPINGGIFAVGQEGENDYILRQTRGLSVSTRK